MIQSYEAKCLVQPNTINNVYQVNENFVLLWTFKNTGSTAWPLDTMFIQSNGDKDMGATPFVMPKSVQPGEEIEISVEFTAPKEAGQYRSFFRFTYKDGIEFGQKTWVIFNVQG